MGDVREGLRHAAEFEDAIARHDVSIDKLNVVLERPANEAVRMAVEAGAGAAVISRLAVEPSLRSGKLKAVPFELAERAFTALRHRERYFSKATLALLDGIKARLAIAGSAARLRS
jgi:DNA-binding transcriptional LysR family regulator